MHSFDLKKLVACSAVTRGNRETQGGETIAIKSLLQSEVSKSVENDAQEYMKNCKIGHINANSIAGHKFYEICHWLRSGFFDVLVISETKLDQSFPNSQFMIFGYRFPRIDRNIHGAGLMLYIRCDIPFKFERSTSTAKIPGLLVWLVIFVHRHHQIIILLLIYFWKNLLCYLRI